MDIVHLSAHILDIVIDDSLQRTHSQLHLGIGDGIEGVYTLPNELDHMTLALALVGVGIGGHEHLHEAILVDVEHHAVDGLELQSVIVVVDHFHQCIAGGKLEVLLGSLAGLLLLVAGLGGSQRVVTVTHGKQERCNTGDTVLALHGCVRGQSLESLGHGVDLSSGELIAADVAALLHQLEVVDLLHALHGGGQRLNNGALGVVDQQHHMGQLDGCVAAHLGAGRNAIQHRTFGSADEGTGTGGEVIGIQIHHTNQAMTDAAIGLLALDVNKALGHGLKDTAVQIFLHRSVDIADDALHIGILQLGLGEDQTQSRGISAHLLLHRLPVFRLGGELVAGHHSPLVHILSLGHQDVGGIKAQLFKLLVHGDPPLKSQIYMNFFFFASIVCSCGHHTTADTHFATENTKFFSFLQKYFLYIDRRCG